MKKFIISIFVLFSLIGIFYFSFFVFCQEDENVKIISNAFIDINEAKSSFSEIERKLYNENFYTVLIDVFQKKNDKEIVSDLKDKLNFSTNSCIISFEFNPNKITCDLPFYVGGKIVLVQKSNEWNCSTIGNSNLSAKC